MNGEHDQSNFNLQMMQPNMQPGSMSAGMAPNLQAQMQQGMPSSMGGQPGMSVQFLNIAQVPRHAQMMTVGDPNQEQNFQNYQQRFPGNYQGQSITPNMNQNMSAHSNMSSNINQNINTNMSANLGQNLSGNITPHAQQQSTNIRPQAASVVFVSNQPQRQFAPSNTQNAFIMNNAQMMQQAMNPMMQGIRMRAQIGPMGQIQQVAQMPANMQMAQAMNQQMFQMGGMRGNTPNNMNMQPQMIRQGPVFMIPQQMQGTQSPYLPQFYSPQGLPIDPQSGEIVNFIQPFGGNIQNQPGVWQQSQNISGSQANVMRENVQSAQGYPVQFISQQGSSYNTQQMGHMAQVRQVTPIQQHPTQINQQIFERSSSQPQAPQNQNQPTPHNISRPISDVSKPSIIHYKPQIAVDKSALAPKIEIDRDADKNTMGESFLMPPSVAIHSPPIHPPSQDVDIFNTTTTIRLCNSIPTCDSGPAINIVEQAIKNLKSDKQIISSIPDSTFVEIVVNKGPRDINFHNKRRFVIKESVFDQIYTRDHIEFQVKCVDNSNTINKWPKVFSLVVNGKLAYSPVIDEITGDESILIKNLIQKDDNLIEITCFVPGDSSMTENDSPKFAFKFLINLVLKSTMSVMCRALVHKRTQSVRKSIEFVQHFFVCNQMEMARGHTIVSLHDPVTNDRIILPVRGENCKHAQCFDFESFFSRHANRTHFICPICGVIGAIPGIIVDGFMCTLVSQIKSQDEVPDVKITPECNWSLLSSKSEESPSKQSVHPISENSNFGVDDNYLTSEQLLNIFGDDKREALINFFNQANVKLPEIMQQTESVKTSPPKSTPPSVLDNELQGLTKRSFNTTENDKSQDHDKSEPFASPAKIQKNGNEASSVFTSLFNNEDEKPITKSSKFARSDNMPDIFGFAAEDGLGDDEPDLSIEALRKNFLDKPDDNLPTTTWDPLDDEFLKQV